MELFGRYSNGYGEWLYLLFRLIVGLIFFMHGSQKLFGWFGGNAIGFSGFLGFIGVLEFLIGLGVFFGFLTRLAALGGAIIMTGAYFTTHLWNPITKGGEPAILFFCAFLILLIYGARKWKLDNLLFKNEVF